MKSEFTEAIDSSSHKVNNYYICEHSLQNGEERSSNRRYGFVKHSIICLYAGQSVGPNNTYHTNRKLYPFFLLLFDLSKRVIDSHTDR